MRALLLLLLVLSQPAFAGWFDDNISFKIDFNNIVTSRQDSVPVEVHMPKKQLASKPVVIYMSGCDGQISDGARTVINLLVARGVAVAELRSIGIWGRLANPCTGEPGHLQGWQRAEEAYRVRDELVKRGIANEDNVGLLGGSHGGWAISYASYLFGNVMYETKNTKPFAAAVALYPHCRTVEDGFDLRTPTLMLLGMKDDWTPPSRCFTLEEKTKEQSTHNMPLELVKYENATHAWDNQKPTRTFWAGQVMTTMSHDPGVTEDSVRRTMDWFEKYLKLD